MNGTKNQDRSAAAGLGTAAGTTAVEGAAVLALCGGSGSASAITYTLATIGGLVGAGMGAGVGLLIGAPVVLGGAVYGVSKAVQKRKGK